MNDSFIKKFILAASILFLVFIPFTNTYEAAWNNNAKDFYNTYGASNAKYLENKFWVSSKSYSIVSASLHYRTLGFKITVNINGTNYSVSSKIGESFSLVSEVTEGQYIYSLWNISYDKIVAKLKSKYPSTDFSSLENLTTTSTFTFDAIMTTVSNGVVKGSINDNGDTISGTVYRTAESLLAVADWSGSTPDDIRARFGIVVTIPPSSKPQPAPSFAANSVTISDYEYKSGSTYWVQQGNSFNVNMTSWLAKKYGVYPDGNYIRFYEGNFSDCNYYTFYTNNGAMGDWNKHFSSYKETSTKSSDSSNNKLSSTFTLTPSKNNSTYRIAVTSLYNNRYNPYTDTGLTVSVDGTSPLIHGIPEKKDWYSHHPTLNLSASDSLSGMQSITVYNNNKKVATGISSVSYTVNNDGINTIKVVATDNVGNSSTEIFTVKVDTISPAASISTNKTTTNKSIKINVSNIIEAESGMKEILLSEDATFPLNNTTKYNITSNVNTSLHFDLLVKNTAKKNYTLRTIYIRLIDNAGNTTDYSITTNFIPNPPEVPVITTPLEDELFLSRNPVYISWTYKSVEDDIGEIPQEKAVIELKNTQTKKIETITISGNNQSTILKDLDSGDYELIVKVYNHTSPDVYSISKVRKFRYNSFKSNGNVFTITIEPGSPIKHLSIATTCGAPKGTNIKGYVYYDVEKDGTVNKNKKIPFTILASHTKNSIFSLPSATSRIKIEYILTGSDSNKFISPELDHINVLAR